MESTAALRHPKRRRNCRERARREVPGKRAGFFSFFLSVVPGGKRLVALFFQLDGPLIRRSPPPQPPEEPTGLFESKKSRKIRSEEARGKGGETGVQGRVERSKEKGVERRSEESRERNLAFRMPNFASRPPGHPNGASKSPSIASRRQFPASRRSEVQKKDGADSTEEDAEQSNLKNKTSDRKLPPIPAREPPSPLGPPPRSAPLRVRPLSLRGASPPWGPRLLISVSRLSCPLPLDIFSSFLGSRASTYTKCGEKAPPAPREGTRPPYL